ncbi:MAG: fructose 1,6-bisphosphatase [Candidatus Bathyarchaeota archaeon]|nr:fructose 1,6-bisphosphatase [Candidatus Bathyarchaeota archaeon]
MSPDFDWEPVLLQCKTNVAVKVQPLLKTLKEPQPDLGRGAGGDQMKTVDLAAEKAIVEVLLQHGISFTLVSEESGIKAYGSQATDWYVTVDPIDGTTNLVRGLPFYCSSIAVSGKPLLSDVYAGIVTDLFHNVTYMAVRGRGASRNGEKIATSSVGSLTEAVIGLDLNTYKAKTVAAQLSELIQKTKHIRHFGANALELCFVAEGLTDAFVDIRGKLRTTDVAAGFLILKEAGGVLSTPDGEAVEADLDPRQTVTFVASGNPQIHKAILHLIQAT